VARADGMALPRANATGGAERPHRGRGTLDDESVHPGPELEARARSHEVRVVYGPLLVSAWGQTTER
jgi:hypothetical protein